MNNPVVPEQSALFKAVAGNRPKTIERLLTEHPHLVNAYHPRLGIPPIWSAFSNRERGRSINQLISMGADVRLPSKRKAGSVLSLALEHHPIWVPFLLEKGLAPKPRSTSYQSSQGLHIGWSDLDLACRFCPHHVPVLLAHGASPNVAPTRYTSSPLAVLLENMVRHRRQDGPYVSALLKAGADPNHCVPPHRPAWIWWWELATRKWAETDTFREEHKWMLERVKDPCMRWNGGTFLHAIAEAAPRAGWDGEQLRQFLKPVQRWMGADAFARALVLEHQAPVDGSDPNAFLKHLGNLGVVALSFRGGASVASAVHAVSRAQVWIELGADPNEASETGSTAAHAIAQHYQKSLVENPEVAREVARLPIDWLAQDRWGQTAEKRALGVDPTPAERVAWRAFVLPIQFKEPPLKKVAPRL